MVPFPTIIATWPSHTARSPGRNDPASTAAPMSCSWASRGIKSRFVIRPLRETAAVQTDAGCGAAPLVGHAELGQGVPDGVGRHLVRRQRGAAVG